MLDDALQMKRTMGLFGATSVGVGAIVGGGILALAGVAFAATGPGALAAFAFNGFIALLTALSFAELSSAIPQSGGTYTFARKVMSVETAFAVGWVVWFASIVAAVLYSLGFASFFQASVVTLWESWSESSPDWIRSHGILIALAIAACLYYFVSLVRSSQGGGPWANIGKVVVFTILIIGGAIAMMKLSPTVIVGKFRPFLPQGLHGLISAMGYTFIALQGFDLIAAGAGEIREPRRTIPRAMLLSLILALIIYLPLLVVVTVVGTHSGESIHALSAENPETIIAVAAGRFLGRFGYWLVMAAGVLSMLSALQANLFAASRVAQAMARDRTLFRPLEKLHPKRGTPVGALGLTTAIVIVIVILIPDVAAAGAASSLIFLITFSLAHLISYLARSRSGSFSEGFRAPLFPLIPILGGVLCLSLALFQGVTVPSAGLIAGGWLVAGAALFLMRFARRARIVDAAAEAGDPQLLLLRGRAPLVLVPIANPASAEGLVGIATALAPNGAGRVLLLSVVSTPQAWDRDHVPQQLVDAQDVLGKSLIASFSNGLTPEALTTVAVDPWSEISRVASDYHCACVLLGFSKILDQINGGHLERLLSSLNSDIAILRAKPGWSLEEVQTILVPVGGKGSHDELRARLLTSLARNTSGQRTILFLLILPEKTSDDTVHREEIELRRLARDEVPGHVETKIIRSSQVIDTIVAQADSSDLLILGLQRFGRHQKVFGSVTLQILERTTCPTIMISRRG